MGTCADVDIKATEALENVVHHGRMPVDAESHSLERIEALVLQFRSSFVVQFEYVAQDLVRAASNDDISLRGRNPIIVEPSILSAKTSIVKIMFSPTFLAFDHPLNGVDRSLVPLNHGDRR